MMAGRRRGQLLSFDGIDSSGKATQAGLLAERLRYVGWRVVSFQTPDYATAVGGRLRHALQDPRAWRRLTWREKMRLFADNRREHRRDVKTALSRGAVVVYDRYVPSSLTFMVVEALAPGEVARGRGRIQRAVARLEYEVNEMPHEDASLFLDVPPAVAASLLEQRKALRQDRDEYTDHLRVQERLYNEYDMLHSQGDDHYLRIPCMSGVELLPPVAISELVWEALGVKFPALIHGHGAR